MVRAYTIGFAPQTVRMVLMYKANINLCLVLVVLYKKLMYIASAYLFYVTFEFNHFAFTLCDVRVMRKLLVAVTGGTLSTVLISVLVFNWITRSC